MSTSQTLPRSGRTGSRTGPAVSRAPAAGGGVAVRTVESPVGPLLLVATDAGLVRVAFAAEDHAAVLAGLERTHGPVVDAPDRLAGAARQLAEYFAGTRTGFDLPLDTRAATGFHGLVRERLRTVAYGTTTTYGDLARQVGNPRAVRAVGSACATNPLPVVVPCHRVLRGDGALGGYLGGTAAKERLLRLEQRVASDRRARPGQPG